MAVGVFDSGVGGLTVVRALRQVAPDCDIVYLGDSARLPYGTKSASTVRSYSLTCEQFLIRRDVDLILIACNTATAFALDELRAASTVPIIGAVNPGAETAAARSISKHIGVIGTSGTVKSGAYETALARILPEASVHTTACPLFVPLAEEGWTSGSIPKQIATHYLQPLHAIDAAIDTLVLGCTHYPLLETVIGEAASSLGWNLTLVDSASAMARGCLQYPDALAGSGNLDLFVTDDSRMESLVERFLGTPAAVTQVDL